MRMREEDRAIFLLLSRQEQKMLLKGGGAQADALWTWRAVDVVEALRKGRVTPLDLVKVAKDRILKVDSTLNAVPIRCFDRAERKARELMETGFPDKPGPGYLYGLPVLIKDTLAVENVRFTMGSLLYENDVATYSEPVVSVLESKGAIVVGKTNTPELGLGSNTYNFVFGVSKKVFMQSNDELKSIFFSPFFFFLSSSQSPIWFFQETVNPWDTTLTCGGSSGGAASALASGMEEHSLPPPPFQTWISSFIDLIPGRRKKLTFCFIPGEAWLAIGTDLGGSTRIPASFCNVVGIRPTPGRVPYSGSASTATHQLHSIVGPMARNVSDLALAMDAVCEKHPGDPNSLAAPEKSYVDHLREHEKHLPASIAWSPNLGGSVPIEQEVVEVCERACRSLANSLKCELQTDCMDLSEARGIFHTLRAAKFKESAWILEHKDKVKPELIWQIEQGLGLEEEDVKAAREGHKAIIESTKDFFTRYDILCCPCTMTPPFDVKIRWLKECAGWEFNSYIDWLMPTSLTSLTNSPSMCVPCGFVNDLPVGLQLVGKPHKEAELLCAAFAFEQAHDFHKAVPICKI